MQSAVLARAYSKSVRRRTLSRQISGGRTCFSSGAVFQGAISFCNTGTNKDELELLILSLCDKFLVRIRSKMAEL